MRKLSMIYENPVDNFLYIYVEILAPYMNKYNITPNMITTLGNISWICGAYLIYNDKFTYGSLLFATSYYFDCLDGYVARKYNQTSIFGDYYDHISDVCKAITYMLLLYYKNCILFKKLSPLIILFTFFIVLHLYYQEKFHDKKKDSPALAVLDNLIPHYFQTKTDSETRKWLTMTRWVGSGTWNLVFCLIIIYFGFSETTREK